MREGATVTLVVVAFGAISGQPLRLDRASERSTNVANAERGCPQGDGCGRLDVQIDDDGTPPSPIAHASVKVLSTREDQTFLSASADTGAKGHAEIAAVPAGEAWIVVDAPGKASAASHLALAAGQTRIVALKLASEHTIDVWVHDDAGSPAMSAEVQVLAGASPIPAQARTDDTGRAHVVGLPAGPYRITARLAGYDDAQADVAQDDATPALVLRKLGGLTVRVRGADDQPLATAHVVIAGVALWPARTLVTDAHGEASIPGLGAGVYALRATRGSDVSGTELGIALDRGEQKTTTLVLRPGRFVDVRVAAGREDDADPVAGARVSLTEAGVSPFPLESTTDARGRARLGPIAPGPSTLSAHAEGFVSPGLIRVPDGAQAPVRVGLVRAATVTGRVVDTQGRPIVGASLEVSGTDIDGAPILDDPKRARFQAAHFDAMLAGPAPLSAGELGVMPGPIPSIPRSPGWTAWPGAAGAIGTTSVGPVSGLAALGRASASQVEPWATRSDGSFAIAPVTPGRVRVVVRHPEFVDAQSEVLVLVPASRENAEIVMHAGGVLEGRVVDADDRPVTAAQVLVSATRGSPFARSTRTAGDGSFTFAALPESVVLSVQSQPGEAAGDRMSVSIPEGGRSEVHVRLPAPRGDLPVHVLGDDGQPVDSAQVSASALARGSSLRVTAFTDDAGNASLRHALGVPLQVDVRAAAYGPRRLVTEEGSDALRIVLAPAVRVTGHVSAERARTPIVGAEVTVFGEAGASHARTDARGTFSFQAVPIGTSRIEIRAGGFAPLASGLTVTSADVRRARGAAVAAPPLRLTPEARVAGEVVDGHGDAVAGARVAQDTVPAFLLVGSTPEGVAITDARGHFELGELPEGSIALEAFAPDLGRGRVAAVPTVGDRTTEGLRIVLSDLPEGSSAGRDTEGGASLAVTLGETGSPPEVVIVSVLSNSEAERAGLAPGDVVLAIDDASVTSMSEARARLTGPVTEDVLLRIRRGEATLPVRAGRDAVRR